MESETYWCESCASYVDPRDIAQIGPADGFTRLPVCPRCRRHVRREVQRTVQPLHVVLARGALWPVGAHAAPSILGTAVFVFVLVRFASLFGIGPMLASGAVLLQAATIVRGTVRGEDEMPAPTHVVGWDHVVSTLAQHVVVLGLGAAPALAVAVLAEDLAPGARFLAVFAASAIGALYVPAAVIHLAVAPGLWSAVDVITPVRYALRIGAPYFVGALAAWLTAVGWLAAFGGALWASGWLGFVPFLPAIAAIAVGVCGVFAVSRVLGLLVREHRDEVALEL